MAGVELTLTKDNGGSQCPHLTPQAGAPTVNGSTALTKSKKKRLRKKKKVETETSQKGLTVITKTVGTDATKSSKVGVDEPVPVVEAVSQKVEAKAPKDKPITVVRAIPKANGKEVNSKNDNLKDPKVASQRNNTKDPELNINIAEDLKVTTLPALKNGEAGLVVMETEKSTRDDVLAQREAKKLAKLAKKNKSGGVQIAPVQADPKQKQPKPNPKAQLTNNVPNPQNASPVSDVTSQMNLHSVDSVDGEIAHKVKHALVTQAEPADSSVCKVFEKLEKSRDEIIAGREGKKQAKLAAKNKKDSHATQPNETAAETTNVAGHKVTKMEESSAQSVQNDVNHVAQDVRPEKSKAALRAERRAKQEAQRAAKEGLVKEAEKTKHVAKPPATMSESAASPKDTIKSPGKGQTKPRVPKAALKSSCKHPTLLSHVLMDSKPLSPHIYLNVHPAIVELGAKYAARVVSGSNARCIALLRALKSVIVDFVTPREKEFSRAMETRLNDSMAYLNTKRQSSVSMTNALKHVKSHLTQLTTEKTSDDDARKKLCEVIDIFIKEQIDVAGQAISSAVAMKISNGDTIAIYGCSSLLLRILVESHNEGKDFEVVVVDGGPLYEGKEMCRRLVSENIKCSYVLLPAFSYIVSQTNKVLLGAHALLANGCVMSRTGTALVAMVAKSHNVPVIVCCETYKFCERVQADAFVHNELGPLTKSSSPPSISLMYDITPPTLVDAVATELAFLPCTSVPVILRVKPSDISSYYY